VDVLDDCVCGKAVLREADAASPEVCPDLLVGLTIEAVFCEQIVERLLTGAFLLRARKQRIE
jgi:hypothetical protein